MFVFVDRQLLKLAIYDWQEFCCICWACWVCWGTCCCCYWDSVWDEDPPITLLTAWCATSDPAPKAIPWTMVLPIPPSMLPLWRVCPWMGVWRAGIGLVAGIDVRVGIGDDDLPLENPPLELLLGIFIDLTKLILSICGKNWI